MKQITIILISFLILYQPSSSWGGKLLGKQCDHGQSIPKVTNFPISLSHKKTILKEGCQYVSSVNGVKPINGNRMVMITLPPNYCSRDDGWDDCTSDRSRIEFYDKNGVGKKSTVTYEYSMFIPSDTDLLQGGDPVSFLGQLNTKSNNHYSSLVMVRWGIEGLVFQLYDKFDWINYRSYYVKNIIPKKEQKDRWINIKYVVDVYSDDRGSIEIIVDDERLVKKENYPTIKQGGKIQLKLGIYDYLVSQMGSERTTQVIYFDNIKKSVKQKWN